MHFEILGEIQSIETIASGHTIRELRRLNRVYGKTTWKKRKGIAKIRLGMQLKELQNYTGTRGTVRERKNSKLRNMWGKGQ